MAGLILILNLFDLSTHNIYYFQAIFYITAEALFFAWLIDRTARGFKGFVGRIFELKPLLYIGKISYGMYLYHFFLLNLMPYI
jgi:peptidoglycan/LPS O-acetylase OafA/YrhL